MARGRKEGRRSSAASSALTTDHSGNTSARSTRTQISFPSGRNSKNNSLSAPFEHGSLSKDKVRSSRSRKTGGLSFNLPGDEFEEEMEILGEFDMQEMMREIPVLDEIEMEKDLRRKKALKRIRIKSKMNLWENCCTEVRDEINDLNSILTMVGLPPYDYSKNKSFPITDYTEAPNIERCSSKDYLDFYVFPYLLPAIQTLILFARQNRIFQCRVGTFNPSDFIAEYLYNSNPRHPARQKEPVLLFKAPFAVKWLARYPRPPVPRWLTLSKDYAASAIQKAFRGFLVRRRPDVQEMRQFWRDINADLAIERCGFLSDCPGPGQEAVMDKDMLSKIPKCHSNLDDSDVEEDGANVSEIPPFKTHSQECKLCAKFKELIARNKKHKSGKISDMIDAHRSSSASTRVNSSFFLDLAANPTAALRIQRLSRSSKQIHHSHIHISHENFHHSHHHHDTRVNSSREDAGEEELLHGSQMTREYDEASNLSSHSTVKVDDHHNYRYKYSKNFRPQYDDCCFHFEEVTKHVSSTAPAGRSHCTIRCDKIIGKKTNNASAQLQEQGSSAKGSASAGGTGTGTGTGTEIEVEVELEGRSSDCILRDPRSCDKFLPGFRHKSKEIRKSSGGSSDTTRTGYSQLTQVNSNGSTIVIKPSNFTIGNEADLAESIGMFKS